MIAHLDADAFFASVLQRLHPNAMGKPLLALGMGGNCVISASYEAKKRGVTAGMRIPDAKKLVPEAVVLPVAFQETGVASEEIETHLKRLCPETEQMSIDEWFMDLASLQGGNPLDLSAWARGVQSLLWQRTHLPVSLGIAPTKTLAKMGSDFRKPRGVTVIEGSSPSDLSIEAFLRDCDINDIPGIGYRRGVHARSHGWKSAFDFAYADPDIVRHLFGRPGEELQQELRGEAVYEVIIEDAAPKSLSRCRTFPKTMNRHFMEAQLFEHLSYVVLRMRHHGLAASGINVWLRDSDFYFSSTDIKIPIPVSTEEQIVPYMERLFRRIFDEKKKWNQVGLALFGLKPEGPAQYSLFDAPSNLDEAESLQKSMDTLRDKYGRDVIRRGYSVLLEKKRKNVVIQE